MTEGTACSLVRSAAGCAKTAVVARPRGLQLEHLENRELLDAAGLVTPPPPHDFLLSTAKPGSVTNSDGTVVEFDDSDVLQLEVRHDHSYRYSRHTRIQRN